MVTYPCLITDFDRKLLVNVAVNVPGLAPRVGFGWGLHGFWRCRVRPRGLAAFGGGCLSVAEMGSRSVFLSGQAAKKNYEHPQRVSPDTRACSRIRTSEPGYAISQRLQVPICSFEVPPSPPPSRKTGQFRTNDRSHFTQSVSAETRISLTCRFVKPGVDDGLDSGLKSVVSATIPTAKRGYIPERH